MYQSIFIQRFFCVDKLDVDEVKIEEVVKIS